MQRARVATLMLVLISGACRAQPLPWPGDEWSRSTASEQGLDEGPLKALDAEFSAGEHGYIDGMSVFRNGHLVFDRSYERDYDTPYQGRDQFPGPYNYYNPEWHPYYQRGDLHTLQSVTKSVTSAVFGIAISRGDLPDVDQVVLDYFDAYEIANLDDRKRRITLHHLLSMTAGLDWPELAVPYEDPENIAVRMERSADWVQFVLDRPMAFEPGTTFAYSSGVSQLLSFLFKRVTGVNVASYAERHLFTPLGIGRYYWKTNPQGLTDTEGGLYLSRHGLARIGYLYLHDGMWAGERVVPEGWVRASVTSHADSTGNRDFAYGYQWWLAPGYQPDQWVYTAWGYGGQYLFVVPRSGLVAVFTGWNIYGHPPLDPVLVLGRLRQAVQ